MAIVGTVTVTGIIAPTSTGDTYPVTDSKYGLDGLRNVSSISERNAISNDRRKQGMIVGVNDLTSTQYWTLKPSPWNGTNDDWVEFNDNDIYISGMSFNVGNYDLTLNRNDGVNFTRSLSILATDMTVTGGTYDINTGVATFTNNSGGTFPVTGFVSGFTDTIITGFTSNGVDTFTIGESNGNSFTAATNLVWTSGSTGIKSIKANNTTGLDATGDYAVAEGRQTIASGNYSHAEGYLSIASGDGSHAEGGGGTSFNISGGTAIGVASHAEGTRTTASGVSSHAEGFRSQALGDSSHAEGGRSTGGAGVKGGTAIGAGSHAEGFLTTASGVSSHAEGNETTAFSDSSHAEGNQTKAGGNYSHAEGSQTTASGRESHAEGYGTTASGNSSHAEGAYSKAIGDGSHAEGGWNDFNFGGTAIGRGSHAEGEQTTAIGDSSHAEGDRTTASGTSSHAEGRATKALGNSSHAGGFISTASGETSFVHGNTSVAVGDNTIVLGANLTGFTNNTTYVEKLNIRDVNVGVPINNLGIDIDGNVVGGSVPSLQDTITVNKTADEIELLYAFFSGGTFTPALTPPEFLLYTIYIKLEQSGGYYVYGNFNGYDGGLSKGIVKILPNGRIDTSFNTGSGFNNYPFTGAMLLEDDFGNLYVSGSFNTYNDISSSRIIKLLPSGDIDTSFDVGLGFTGFIQGFTLEMAFNVDKTAIYVTGRYGSYKGTSVNKLAKVLLNGDLDTSFVIGSGFDNTTLSVVVNSDDSLFVTTYSTTYKGVAIPNIIKLLPNGDRDISFNAGSVGFNTVVNQPNYILKTPDDKLIAIGYFTSYNGTAANRIIKLNLDGTVDNSFVVGDGFDSYVNSIQLVDNNTKYLCVGNFTSYKGVATNGTVVMDLVGNIIVTYVNSYSTSLYINNALLTLAGTGTNTGKLVFVKDDIEYLTLNQSLTFDKTNGKVEYNLSPNIVYDDLSENELVPKKFIIRSVAKTSSFTAENSGIYNTNETITITDPAPDTNKGYIVYVIDNTTTIGGVGYTTGALIYRFFNGTSWVSTDMNAAGGGGGTFTGGTVSGPTSFTNGLTADTISATTISADSLTSTNVNITLPSITGSTGEIVYFGSGTGLTAGLIYYFNSSGEWTVANATASSSSKYLIGIALGTSITSGILIRGYARYSVGNYSSVGDGDILYLGTTNGFFQTTAPSTSTQVVRIIGYGIDSANDTIYFNPDNTWIEIL